MRYSQVDKAVAKYLSRLKVVLAEQHKTNLWLSRTLGKDPATVSKWCTNAAQLSLETLYVIADCLKVDVRTLIKPNEAVMVSEPEAEYIQLKIKDHERARFRLYPHQSEL